MLPFLNFLFLDTDIDGESGGVPAVDFREKYPAILSKLSSDEYAQFLLRQAIMSSYLSVFQLQSRELYNFQVWLNEQIQSRKTLISTIHDEHTALLTTHMLQIADDALHHRLHLYDPAQVSYWINGFDKGYHFIPTAIPPAVVRPFVHWCKLKKGFTPETEESEGCLMTGESHRIFPRLLNLTVNKTCEFDPVSSSDSEFRTYIFDYLSSFSIRLSDATEIFDFLSRFAVSFESPGFFELASDFLSKPYMFHYLTYSPVLERDYQIHTNMLHDFVDWLYKSGVLDNMDHVNKTVLQSFINTVYGHLNPQAIGEDENSAPQIMGTTEEVYDNNMTKEGAIPVKVHHVKMNTAAVFSQLSRIKRMSPYHEVNQSVVQQENSVLQKKQLVNQFGDEEEGGEEPAFGEEENADEGDAGDNTHTVKEKISDILGFKFKLNEEATLNGVVFRSMVEQAIDNLLKASNSKLTVDQLTALRYFKIYWLFIVNIETIKNVLEVILGKPNPITNEGK